MLISAGILYNECLAVHMRNSAGDACRSVIFKSHNGHLNSILSFDFNILITLTVNMPKITPQTLDRALTLLGELMEVRRHPAQHFVVCGGSSLIALGLVSRTTTVDVDILARIEHNSLVTPRPLPGWLIAAVADVQRQLNLPDDWLNAQVADETLFNCGLPEGLQSRLISRNIGSRLIVSYISRRDQIFLKLHAAVDRDGGRHLQDLLELSPTADELLDAARWTRTQDPSEGVLMLLRSMLASLGHEYLNDKL